MANRVLHCTNRRTSLILNVPNSARREVGMPSELRSLGSEAAQMLSNTTNGNKLNCSATHTCYQVNGRVFAYLSLSPPSS